MTNMLGNKNKDTTDTELYNFLEEHGDTDAKLQVLRFWGQHPRAKFSLPCITTTTPGIKKPILRAAVQALVDAEVIQEQRNGNGITWYSLACDQQIQERVTKLAELDWNKARLWKERYIGNTTPTHRLAWC